jgi:hypothetical protein
MTRRTKHPIIARVLIWFHNKKSEPVEVPFESFLAARLYCQENISYSGGKIRRVEMRDVYGGGDVAIWDAGWDDVSKKAGLYNVSR